MTTKPEVRIARGTLPPIPVEELIAECDIVGESENVAGRPLLRMTSQPPRFTTTTPGVMRRLAR